MRLLVLSDNDWSVVDQHLHLQISLEFILIVNLQNTACAHSKNVALAVVQRSLPGPCTKEAFFQRSRDLSGFSGRYYWAPKWWKTPCSLMHSGVFANDILVLRSTTHDEITVHGMLHSHRIRASDTDEFHLDSTRTNHHALPAERRSVV